MQDSDFSKLRELLNLEPSPEHFTLLLDYFKQLAEPDALALALEYAQAHLENWSVSARAICSFDPNHPAWKLVRWIQPQNQQHSISSALAEHPHIIGLDLSLFSDLQVKTGKDAGLVLTGQEFQDYLACLCLRDRIEGLCEELSKEYWELQLVALYPEEDLIGTIRVVIWTDPPESPERFVQDIREQNVCMVGNWKVQSAQKLDLVFGFLKQVGLDNVSHEVESFLPCDLFLSELWEAETEEDILRKYIGEDQDDFDQILNDLKVRYSI